MGPRAGSGNAPPGHRGAQSRTKLARRRPVEPAGGEPRTRIPLLLLPRGLFQTGPESERVREVSATTRPAVRLGTARLGVSVEAAARTPSALARRTGLIVQPRCSGPPPPSPPGRRGLRAKRPNSKERSQVYLALNSPRPCALRRRTQVPTAALAREPAATPTLACGNGGTFSHSETHSAAPAARAPHLAWAQQHPRAPCCPRPSPCSGAPSGGGSSSSDLRCWGLACLRRDMLLAALQPRAGQRHQLGGRRGRRGVAGRARGAGRRRLRGPRMGLSN